jgi:uncharacterized protein YdeI (YjbR/CyaY-like superfamily)
MPTPKPKSFRATLERLDSSLGWVIARIPFDVKKTWGRSRVKVRGEVNGFSFRTSLFAKKDGSHFLLVNKKMQKGAGVLLGSTAEFQLAVDNEPREVPTPAELSAIFKQSRSLSEWFDALSYSYRREISRWISEPRSAESRKRRADQMAERLLETIEAERELPPLIKSALAQNGKARQGWALMTPIQRRSQLMGIFYYRTPDARARRLEKALQMAAAIAEKKEANS